MKYEVKLLVIVVMLVVLPCVLLSTFALQALVNQKVIIEQKIKESYEALASSTRKHLMDGVANKINVLDNILRKQSLFDAQPPAPVLQLPLKEPFFQFVYLLDQNFEILYPKGRPQNSIRSKASLPFANYHIFEDAYFYEYQKRDYLRAIAEYQKIVAHTQEQKLENLNLALFAIARCNLKASNLAKAIETYQYIATLCRDRSDSQSLDFMVKARYQIAEIYKLQKDMPAYYQLLLRLLEYIIENEYRLETAQYVYHYRCVTQALTAVDNDRSLAVDAKKTVRSEQQKILQKRKRLLVLEQQLKIARQDILPRLRLLLKQKQMTGYIAYRIGDEQKLAYYRQFQRNNFSGYVVYAINVRYCIDKMVIPILEGQEARKGIQLTIVDQHGVPVYGKPLPSFYSVVSQSLAPVFPFWQLVVHLQNARSLEELSRYRSHLYLYGLITVILTLLVGIYISITTLIREVKSARLKSDFVSNITHELKTPLTAIKLFVETLLMGRAADEAERRECLQIIAAESDRLSRLIDRILDFARMEQKRRTFYFLVIRVEELLQKIVSEFQNQAPEHCHIRVEVNGDIPEIIVDQEAIREALFNLLSNACKYNDKPKKQIVIKAIPSNSTWLTITVKDNGIGIARHEFSRIFQKFYRIEDTLTREVEGTGLGLSLVKSIVNAHKGKIKVQSKKGIGSEFTIMLPLSADGHK